MTLSEFLLTAHHFLLRSRLQGAGRLGRGAQLLDDVGHILGLVDEGVSEVARPVEVVVHLLDDVGEANHRLDAGVPVHRIGAGVVALTHRGLIALKPARCLDDLQGVGRRGQQLRQQDIGIKRDRLQEFPQLILRKGGVRVRLHRSRGRRLRRSDRRPCHRHRDEGGAQPINPHIVPPTQSVRRIAMDALYN